MKEFQWWGNEYVVTGFENTVAKASIVLKFPDFGSLKTNMIVIHFESVSVDILFQSEKNNNKATSP